MTIFGCKQTENHESNRMQMLISRLRAFVWFIFDYLFGRRRFKGLAFKRKGKVRFSRTHRKPRWVVREIVRCKALMPGAGARRIALSFNRRFEVSRQMTVSKSYVAYTLRREAYRVAEQRRAIRRHQAKPGKRNLVWGLDLTGKCGLDGEDNSILGIIDHGTRKLLCLERPLNATGWTVLGYLFLAVGRYGKPKAVRTDNGGAFASKLFGLVLTLAGIRHQRTEPGCPWQNGRVERLFGTLKQVLDQLDLTTSAGLSLMLSEFTFWYNRVRPHQNLDGRTPYEEWHGIDPYATAPKRVLFYSAWDGLLTGFLHRR